FVLEIDGGELGADPRPFSLALPAGHVLAPIAPSASSAVTWLRLIALRRERAACEREIADLGARDGFTGRAAAHAKLRLEALTSALAQRRPDAAQSAMLRAWIDELFGLAREEVRQER